MLLLMSPWLVGFSVFFGYPLVMSAYLSFNHYDLLSPPRWVGLANYRYLFTIDPQVWTAVENTLWMIAVLVPLQVVFALRDRADARARKTRRRHLPDDLLPARARAARRRDARLRLHPQPGDRPGEHDPRRTSASSGPLWFQDPAWSKPSLVLLGLWGVGNTMVIFLAAVLDVPAHLYESAELDGAGPLQRLRWVTLPTISPVILFAVDPRRDPGPAVLHAGVRRRETSPRVRPRRPPTSRRSSLGYPLDSTLFYPVLLYQHGFTDFQMGYASAMAMLLLVVSFAVTLVIVLNSRRWVHQPRGRAEVTRPRLSARRSPAAACRRASAAGAS